MDNKPKAITLMLISALAFSIATAITFMSQNIFLATLSYLIAFLAAESRVEVKIHSFFEVFTGALLGILITVLVFQTIG